MVVLAAELPGLAGIAAAVAVGTTAVQNLSVAVG